MKQNDEPVASAAMCNEPQRIASLSRWMARTTIGLVAVIVSLNLALWIVPSGAQIELEHFSLTTWSSRMGADLGVDIAALPWWQRLGGMVLGNLPLVAVIWGAIHLCRLFRLYARNSYFSSQSAIHMGKVGKAAILWVVISFICEPLLSVWLTMTAPKGERMVTLGVHNGYIEVLFLAGVIAVIAHILRKAGELDEENQSFI